LKKSTQSLIQEESEASAYGFWRTEDGDNNAERTFRATSETEQTSLRVKAAEETSIQSNQSVQGSSKKGEIEEVMKTVSSSSLHATLAASSKRSSTIIQSPSVKSSKKKDIEVNEPVIGRKNEETESVGVAYSTLNVSSLCQSNEEMEVESGEETRVRDISMSEENMERRELKTRESKEKETIDVPETSEASAYGFWRTEDGDNNAERTFRDSSETQIVIETRESVPEPSEESAYGFWSTEEVMDAPSKTLPEKGETVQGGSLTTRASREESTLSISDVTKGTKEGEMRGVMKSPSSTSLTASMTAYVQKKGIEERRESEKEVMRLDQSMESTVTEMKRREESREEIIQYEGDSEYREVEEKRQEKEDKEVETEIREMNMEKMRMDEYQMKIQSKLIEEEESALEETKEASTYGFWRTEDGDNNAERTFRASSETVKESLRTSESREQSIFSIRDITNEDRGEGVASIMKSPSSSTIQASLLASSSIQSDNDHSMERARMEGVKGVMKSSSTTSLTASMTATVHKKEIEERIVTDMIGETNEERRMEKREEETRHEIEEGVNTEKKDERETVSITQSTIEEKEKETHEKSEERGQITSISTESRQMTEIERSLESLISSSKTTRDEQLSEERE
ncbi:hypothetical protein PENTCL1PPCAC_6375, partial [Pristionchus entomophagus]